MTAGRVFVLLANSARPEPAVPLDDLPGKGARFDLVARFVNATLLTSHGIREEAEAWVAFTRPEEGVWLRIVGSEVARLQPDERSTAARLLSALEATPMPVWQAVDEGIEARTGELGAVLEDAPSPVVLMHEEGRPLPADLAGGTFLVGDHEGFTDEQREALGAVVEGEVRLGSRSLQADAVAAVLHHELDR